MIAGDAGIWFLTEAGNAIYRIDRSLVTKITLARAAYPSQVLTAMGNRGPVLVTPDRTLKTVVGAAVRSVALPDTESPPRALTATGTTAYIAYPDHVMTYDLMTLTQGASIPVSGVTAMTAGPDGVWAATDGSLIQLAR